MEIALAKLGLTALLLSVNNSPAAIAHLVKQTTASHLIYGSKFRSTAEEVKRVLHGEGYDVDVLPEKRFPIWGKGGIEETVVVKFDPVLSPEEESRRSCVILHSSGSVSSPGFPAAKPGKRRRGAEMGLHAVGG